MKIVVGMPCIHSIPMKTVVSLLNVLERGKVEPFIVEGSLVYDSRDTISAFAVNNNYDYLLFVDSDMIFTREDIITLVKHNTDIVSGLYVTRHGEDKNVAYTDVITRRSYPLRLPELIHDTKTSGYGEITACGFGFCLIKTSVLKRMFKRYKSLFEPKWGVGEDVAFCLRARKCGYKIMIDRDVKLGHIGDKIYKA